MNLRRAVEDVEVVAGHDFLHGVVLDPLGDAASLRRVAVVEVVEHQAYAGLHGIAVVDFDAVVALTVDLAGKSAQHRLKERVYRADIEVVVVEEQLSEGFGGHVSQLAAGAAVFSYQGRGVGCVIAVGSGVRGEGADFFEYSRLHLVGGLVGECDGEDAAVAVAAV